jgi:hypothetical protein
MPVPPSQTLNFSWTLGDHAVLQRAPAIAAVYGFLGTATHTGDATVSVTVTPDADDDSVEAYTVVANVTAEPVTGSTWKALLKPMASKAGQTFTITATCTTGCTGSATIKDVVFGEVWYCAGQSESVSPPVLVSLHRGRVNYPACARIRTRERCCHSMHK